MDGGAWWAAVRGVAESRTRLSDFTFTFHFHALEKEMATHSSVLAWRIPEKGEPGGLPSMGLNRVRHDWSDLEARVARESWGLRSSHRRAEETAPRRVSGTYSSSPGKAGISGLHSRLPRGVRPRLEGKPRTPLSSGVATRVSWSPLSGLKGVQPPLPFGERTRDCSPGHAGKEGPELARTGA